MPEPLECAAQLGLENHRYRDDERWECLAQKPVQRLEMEEVRCADHEDNENDETTDELGGSRSLDDPQEPIENEGHRQYIHQGPQIDAGENPG